MSLEHRKLHAPLAATVLATALLPLGARAQNVENAYQTWLGLFAQGPIAGRVYFQGDLHYRAYADFSPYWVLVRPGIGYSIMPGMFATVGYAWTPSWRAPDLAFEDRVDEHRIWEQWQYEFPLAGGALKLQLRTRLEERLRPDVGSDLGLRGRQMVRVTVPCAAHWFLAAWDELFIAFNNTDWKQHAGFDQNRLFVGAGVWAVPSTLRLEVGYFNQYLHRYNNPAGDLANHALMVNTYVSWR